jgi:hypothetical protein
MPELPFQKPGRFYRGNLHTHSTNSDGMLAPAQVAALYRAEGYDFIAITDHHSPAWDYQVTDTRALRSEGFTTIIGAELHTPGLSTGLPWHLLAVGLPLNFPGGQGRETGPELAARAAQTGAFIGIAHPAWYALQLDEARAVEAAHAIEVYNETCKLLNDRGDSWSFADALLAEGRRLSAFGADDLHMTLPERPDAFGAWVWVRSTALDPDALVDALKAGDYYTSQGPEIDDIRIEDGALSVSCTPASAIYITGNAAKSASLHGVDLTEARLPLDLFEDSHCRVTVVDASGKRAWSNPIWFV